MRARSSTVFRMIRVIRVVDIFQGTTATRAPSNEEEGKMGGTAALSLSHVITTSCRRLYSRSTHARPRKRDHKRRSRQFPIPRKPISPNASLSFDRQSSCFPARRTIIRRGGARGGNEPREVFEDERAREIRARYATRPLLSRREFPRVGRDTRNSRPKQIDCRNRYQCR